MKSIAIELCVSRDAQIIAYSLFAFGQKSSVTFRAPGNLTERAVVALAELEELGFVVRSVDSGPMGSWHFKGTEKLLKWRTAICEPKEGESFPILKESAA
jgi:hypothetical protein